MLARRKPLACSTTTRLVSAERSRGITIDGVGARSWRIATHAMCARVWPTRRSDSLSSPACAPKRPSAPRTTPAARMGTACTEAKPASMAAGTKRGHLVRAASRSVTETGWPVA